MKKFGIILLVLPFIYLASACEDDDLETTGIDPFFRMQFINADSLSSLDELIAVIDESIDMIDDSLVFYDTLNDGTDVAEDVERLNTEKTSLNSEKSEFNSIKAVIESGSVVINSITSSTGVEAKIPGIDSATIFSVPLDPSADFSDFEISLAGTLYDLQTTYTRNTRVDNDQRIIEVEALDLIVNSSVFDSLELTYEDSLSNNSIDAIVTAYF